MRRAAFPSVIPVLLTAMLACNSVGEPAPIILPPADPGQLIPGYPQVSGFPNKGWDLERNSIIVIDPKYPTTDILQVDLDTRAPSLIRSTTRSVQQLRAAASGVVLYTEADASDNRTLQSLDGGKIADVGAVFFALSENGAWAVLYDGGWQRMELATGSRAALPAIDSPPPVAISDDGSRIAFAYSFSREVKIVTVSTGQVTSMQSPEPVLDVVFNGSDLHLLTVNAPFTAETTPVQFYDRSSSGAVVSLGVVTPLGGKGWSLQTCGAWSRGEGARTAVVAQQMTYSYDFEKPQRFNFVRLGENPEIVGSADLFSAPECHVSPDGAWFVYGTYTGNDPGKLYLKKIK